ncbi:hypothetical protein R1flu_021052 [Riccia fluitans]|uniref:Uncharacterized protein n=1 Tax=Riccia fluitans TaxID=41844 RepID=A0ABD1ZRY3_9MARC
MSLSALPLRSPSIQEVQTPLTVPNQKAPGVETYTSLVLVHLFVPSVNHHVELRVLLDRQLELHVGEERVAVHPPKPSTSGDQHNANVNVPRVAEVVRTIVNALRRVSSPFVIPTGDTLSQTASERESQVIEGNARDFDTHEASSSRAKNASRFRLDSPGTPDEGSP